LHFSVINEQKQRCKNTVHHQVLIFNKN